MVVNVERTHVGSGWVGIEYRSDVRVGVLDVGTDERDLRITQHHRQRVVVWHEQLHAQVGRADWKRDLQLEMHLTADHDRRRQVVDVGLVQRERHVRHERHSLRPSNALAPLIYDNGADRNVNANVNQI